MKDNCESAGYERECVHYRVRHDGETDGPKSKYDDCDVTDRNPEGPVKRDTTIILDLDTTTCDLEPEEENTGPNDPDETGDIDESTGPNGTGDDDETNGTGDTGE